MTTTASRTGGVHRRPSTNPYVPWLVLVARLILGGVWIVAGATKIGDLDGSVRAVRAYQLLPEAIAEPLGAGLPLVEIVIGVLLIIGLAVRATSIVSVLLMAAFVVGIAAAWARGLRIDCGCFGSGGELAEGTDPTYGWELVRDGALLACALFLVVKPSGRFGLDRTAQKEIM